MNEFSVCQRLHFAGSRQVGSDQQSLNSTGFEFSEKSLPNSEARWNVICNFELLIKFSSLFYLEAMTMLQVRSNKSLELELWESEKQRGSIGTSFNK